MLKRIIIGSIVTFSERDAARASREDDEDDEDGRRRRREENNSLPYEVVGYDSKNFVQVVPIH